MPAVSRAIRSAAAGCPNLAPAHGRHQVLEVSARACAVGLKRENFLQNLHGLRGLFDGFVQARQELPEPHVLPDDGALCERAGACSCAPGRSSSRRRSSPKSPPRSAAACRSYDRHRPDHHDAWNTASVDLENVAAPSSVVSGPAAERFGQLQARYSSARHRDRVHDVRNAIGSGRALRPAFRRTESARLQ